MLATRHPACSVSPHFASCAGRKRVLHVGAYQNGRVDVGSKYAAPDTPGKFFQELRDGLAELDQRIPDKVWDDIIVEQVRQQPAARANCRLTCLLPFHQCTVQDCAHAAPQPHLTKHFTSIAVNAVQALNKEPFTETEIIIQVAKVFEQEVTVYRTSNPGVRESVPRTELLRYCSSLEHFEGFLKQKLGIPPQQEVELCWGVTEEPFAGQQFALQCPDDFPLPVLMSYADSWGVDDSMS